MSQKRMEKLETYMLTVIEDRRTGRPASILRWFLKQLSRIYTAIVQLRLALFTHGIFRPHTLGCQVVSVGNLTVGGTGKTPIVEIFARSLQKQGRKVAILSRGYKRHEPPLYKRLFDRLIGKRKLLPTLVVSDGKHLLLDSDVSGDEPYMLASNLPNVAVLVNRNRVKAGQYAITKLGCDTLILDDGFQYLHLKHRLDIVLVDRNIGFGNRCLIPRGILREPLSALQAADLIILTKKTGETRPHPAERHIAARNPRAPVFSAGYAVRGLTALDGSPAGDLQGLAGKNLLAVAGIGNPGYFLHLLHSAGVRVAEEMILPDHHRYTAADAEKVMKQFRTADYAHPFKVGPFTISFSPAGHILGSSCVRVECEGKSITFSGDVGRPQGREDNDVPESRPQPGSSRGAGFTC